MEQLNEIWLLYIQPIVSSAVFSAICLAILTAVIKALINKHFSKINIDTEIDKIANVTLDRFKGMTFKQNIEPLVKTELIDITSMLVADMELKYKRIVEMNVKIAKLVSHFSMFFENSYGIPDEYKELVKQDLEDIQLYIMPETTEVETVECTPVITEKTDKVEKAKVKKAPVNKPVLETMKENSALER